MIDFILGHYAYWFIVTLMLMGISAMVVKRNLVKKLIGMNIMQTAVIMFYIAGATKWNATVPVFDPTLGLDPEGYINPLPHTLMLTAIVVSVATTGVAFALLILIYRQYQTLDETTLLEHMND